MVGQVPDCTMPPPTSSCSPPRNVPSLTHILFLSFLPGAETSSDLAGEPREVRVAVAWGALCRAAVSAQGRVHLQAR